MSHDWIVQRILADEPLPVGQQIPVVCIGCNWRGARHWNGGAYLRSFKKPCPNCRRFTVVLHPDIMHAAALSGWPNTPGQLKRILRSNVA